MYSIWHSGGLPGVYAVAKAETAGTERGCPPASRGQGRNGNCIVRYHKSYCFGKSSSRTQDFPFVHVDKEQDSGESSTKGFVYLFV